MNIHPLSERQRDKLVRRAQKGDEAAFEQLVRDAASTLYRVCLGATGGNEDEAAEAVQDALLAAWKSIASLREPRYFKTWLTRICLNACTDLARKRRHCDLLDERADELADPAPHPAAALEANVGFRELVQAAGADNGAVIALYYGEGYQTDEIAELLGLKVATVRQRLSRGRRAIARALAIPEPTDPDETAPASPIERKSHRAPASPRAPGQRCTAQNFQRPVM